VSRELPSKAILALYDMRLRVPPERERATIEVFINIDPDHHDRVQV